MDFDPSNVILTINGKEVDIYSDCNLHIDTEKKISFNELADEDLKLVMESFNLGLDTASINGMEFKITSVSVEERYVTLSDPLNLIELKPH